MLLFQELRVFHLINFDPRSIKALDSAILECNRLRQEFRSSLHPPFTLPKQRPKSISDRQWCTIRSASEVQRPINQSVQHVQFTGKYLLTLMMYLVMQIQ